MRSLLILPIILLLFACSSVSTQYYHLSDDAFRLPENTQNKTYLVVNNAPYLNTRSLVYQTSDKQRHFASHHLWVEDLHISVAKVLANKLNQLNPSYAYSVINEEQMPMLKITLESFQGSDNGEVQIQGYAQYYNEKKQSTAVRNFSIQVPQQGNGYQAMVQALDIGLEQLATKLAP